MNVHKQHVNLTDAAMFSFCLAIRLPWVEASDYHLFQLRRNIVKNVLKIQEVYSGARIIRTFFAAEEVKRRHLDDLAFAATKCCWCNKTNHMC